MHSRTRFLVILAGLATFMAPAASAQNLAVYGAAEAAGFGEGSAILGASLTPGHLGWNWFVGANVQTYRYLSGQPVTGNTYEQKVAFNPSVGAQYRAATGAITGTVGYNFTSSDVAGGVGGAGGGVNSPTLGLQGDYWGGIYEHGFIVSYATESEYIWTRARLAARPVATVPVYVGGEYVLQGADKFGFRHQAGPTINFHVNPNFHVGFNGGVRWNAGNAGFNRDAKSGYLGIFAVALSTF